MSGPWQAVLSDLAIAQIVGPEALVRAMAAVRSGHVHDVDYDDDTLTISGRVKGTYRDAYAVTIYLSTSVSGATTVYRSQCTCPVALDCKHAAAVLIVARHQLAARQRQEKPQWEVTLGRLVDQPPADPSTAQPLALEFGVERIPAYRGYPGRQELRIRPARTGKSGSWIRSGISWDDLDYVSRSYRLEHRDLLLQFRSAAGAHARYALPRNGWLGLDTVSSVFWSLLDQAGDAGLTLVAAKPLVGPLQFGAGASVSLDARRAGAAGLLVGPQVHLAGQRVDLETVGVLGEPAHGIFVLDRSDPAREELTIARLIQPLSRDLRQLVVDSRAVIVPATDEGRFLAEFLPGLRRQLTISSTDGSVQLPTEVVPRLGLTVTNRTEHRIRLDWTVHYDVGGQSRVFAVDEVAGAGLRDLAQERALLAALPLPYESMPALAAASVRTVARTPAAHALLEGLTAVTFVERVLPLVEKEGVTITVVGDVLDYRESAAEPTIEISTVERPESADWFDLHVAVSVEGEQVPFDQLFVALSQGEDYVILDTGVYFALDRPQFVQLRSLIEESRGLADHESSQLRINRVQASLWSELVDLGVVIEQSARWARTVRGLNEIEAVDRVPVPAGLQAELRPYQVDGFRWLHFLWSAQLGGVLADDMGLGKTLQTLAMICQARIDAPDGPPFLVVAPTSVVSGWAGEAARFAPDLRTVTVRRSQAKSPDALAELAAGSDVVITSYALLRIDGDAYAGLPWSGLILDEAQFVKNYRGKTYQCARRVTAPFTLAITGTPLENNLMDLWALLSLAAPGLFPSPVRFSEFYRRPIERSFDADRLRQLRRRIRPVMLRRTKDSVAAELPPKQEQVVEIELDPRHLRIYQTHLQRERQKVLGLIDDLDHNRFTILRSLTLLRRLSLDPSLLNAADAGVPAAKVTRLLTDLTEIVAEGHQALVFSQFTTFLGRIRERLDQAGLPYAYLDGKTRDRDQAVQSFRSGAAAVFLISLKAGGFGLNLTEADYCFVLDPWWNPATEAQAVDRTHRIGQTKTVLVYRLVAKDTIEEKVMALKAQKEKLFGAVFSDDALAGGQLTSEEIRQLLAV